MTLPESKIFGQTNNLHVKKYKDKLISHFKLLENVLMG